MVSPGEEGHDLLLDWSAHVFRLVVSRYRRSARPLPLGRDVLIRYRTSQFDRCDWFVWSKP